MALNWPAKAAGDVIEYRWTPSGEGVATASVAVSSGTATASYQIEGDTVVFTVTGGAADVVQVLALTATTGTETFTETAYLPIRATTRALSYTARDVCKFALRKVVGNGNEPDAIELDDALERLNDMLAAWKAQGADIGALLPLVAGDTLEVSDAFLQGIKANLILKVADLYDVPLAPVVVEDARRGLQQIKSALLSKDRSAVYF